MHASILLGMLSIKFKYVSFKIHSHYSFRKLRLVGRSGRLRKRRSSSFHKCSMGLELVFLTFYPFSRIFREVYGPEAGMGFKSGDWEAQSAILYFLAIHALMSNAARYVVSCWNLSVKLSKLMFLFHNDKSIKMGKLVTLKDA